MINENKDTLWSIMAVTYIICNITFCAGNLVMLNSLSMYIFLGVSAAHILHRRYLHTRSLFGIISLLAFGIMLAISMLYAPYTDYSKSFANSTLYDYVTMIIILFCFTQYMSETKKIRLVWTAYFIGGVTLSLYVFSMYGADFWSILRANAAANSNNIARIGTGFVNTNTIGIYASISFCLGIYSAFFDKKNNRLWLKIVAIAAASICFVMAMASGSKKSFVIMLAFFVAMFWYKQLASGRVFRGFKYIIAMVAMIALLVLLIQKLPVFSGIATRMENFFNFLKLGEGSASDVERSSFISQGIKYWISSPVWGNGLGSSVYYMGMYAHNNFIEILMSVGLLGFVLFYRPIIASIVAYIKNKIIVRVEKTEMVLGFSLLIMSFVCGVAAVYYFDRYWMILIFSTIMMARNRRENEDYVYEE